MADLDYKYCRDFAVYTMNEHNPDNQDHPYERCALCHYTHHPCDVFELAEMVINLLDQLGK